MDHATICCYVHGVDDLQAFSNIPAPDPADNFGLVDRSELCEKLCRHDLLHDIRNKDMAIEAPFL